MGFYLKGGISLEWSYTDILRDLLMYGTPRQTRGTKSVELSPFCWMTDNPLSNILTNKVRKVSKAFSSAEFLWLMSGRNDVEMLRLYNKNIINFSDNGLIYEGAYGPRIRQQLEYILSTLTNDPQSRQAIITIWERNPMPSRDIPCTISMQFLVVDERLNMLVNMRSNDVWLGFPYDVFNFTMIQNYVACKLGLEIGTYTHFAGSLHLYNKDIEKARAASCFPTLVSDINESAVMEIDQLKETLFYEQQIRAHYESRNTAMLPGFAAVAQAELKEPWKTLFNNLYRKLKK